MSENRVYVKFKLYCKETELGDNIYIVGNINEFGNWNTDNFNENQKLKGNLYPMWLSDTIPIENKKNIEYKYIIKGPNNKLKWEDCGNRELNLKYTIFRKGAHYIDDGFFGN